MWHHYHQLRRLVVTDLRSSFHAWFHATKHSRLHKAMMVHARKQKQDRFQEQMTRAAQADRAHDQRQLHLIVRELSPKQPTRPIRFRSATGLAQSPEVELDLLRRHFETVYCGSTPQLPSPSVRLSCMPFTVADLRHHLARVPLTKAVAPGSLQPAVVRCLATELAQIWSACGVTVRSRAGGLAHVDCQTCSAHPKRRQAHCSDRRLGQVRASNLDPEGPPTCHAQSL